jgi:hypothetical protein
MVESVFSSLDRLGLSEPSLVHRQSLSRQGIVPYRKTQGLVFHLYAVLLGYGLFKLMEHSPAWRLLLAQFGGMWLVAFPNWGKSIDGLICHRTNPDTLLGPHLNLRQELPLYLAGFDLPKA